MACHYAEQAGHTEPVINAWYVRWLKYAERYNWYRLISYNATTGTATMLRSSGRRIYVSLTELSHWHRVNVPEGTET
jgi:hypothetical protein